MIALEITFLVIDKYFFLMMIENKMDRITDNQKWHVHCAKFKIQISNIQNWTNKLNNSKIRLKNQQTMQNFREACGQRKKLAVKESKMSKITIFLNTPIIPVYKVRLPTRYFL